MSLPRSRFAPVLLLGLVTLLAACNDSSVTAPAAAAPPAATHAEPDYWPTTDWQTATPEAQGFAAGAFDTLAADAATALPYHTSLLVIRDGWLVHEHYNDPPSGALITADTRHHVWSVTKSVTSLTVGRAITLGHLQMSDLDATVENTLPAEVVATLPLDDRRGISLRDVLEMRSGIAWNEPAWLLNPTRDPISLAGSRIPPCPVNATLLLCSILQQPMAYTPGTTWSYSTYDSYLASAFVSEILSTRYSLSPVLQMSEYASEFLFLPLGITFAASDWGTAGTAYTFGGGGLNIRSRDLAKLGMLMQYEGRWEDEQLISPEWMDLSIAPLDNSQVPVFDSNGEPAGSSAMDVPYGLQWWRTTEPGFGGPAAISARGMGGQKVQVFRDKGLVIVITCGDVTPGDPGLGTREAEINTFLQTHVLDKLVN